MNIIYKKFSSDRKFGVEMEVNNTTSQLHIHDMMRKITERPIQITHWSQTENNKYWHVKYDSTCGIKGKKGGDHGWEIASFVASGNEDLKEIASVANALQRGGLQVNENCGLHIHADASDFAPEEMAVLVARWIKIEKMMFQMVPLNRIKNTYCRSFRTHRTPVARIIREYNDNVKNKPLLFWNTIRPTNLSVHENSQKKVSLNLVNYATGLRHFYYSRKTVELRLPEGTLDGDDIQNWVRLFLLFVDNSRGKTMPNTLANVATIDNFLSYFGLNKHDEFYLLDKDLHNLKSWILNRLSMYGNKKTNKVVSKKMELITA